MRIVRDSLNLYSEFSYRLARELFVAKESKSSADEETPCCEDQLVLDGIFRDRPAAVPHYSFNLQIQGGSTHVTPATTLLAAEGIFRLGPEILKKK